MDKGNHANFIKFLGTAGARFVMIKQLRASGGIWISCGPTNILVDPGPGSIVRCAQSKPKLDPSKLDAIILTHRHLDHSGDINVMIEAMTEGGFKKRGIVFCPKDALERDPVILRHLYGFPAKIEILKANTKYRVGAFRFSTSSRHKHPVETYGIKFRFGKVTVSLLSDTEYFRGLGHFYKTGLLIINVVFSEPRNGIQHLSVPDVEKIIRDLEPRQTVLTHFGMSMLRAKPNLVAQELAKTSGLKVISAYDGMTLNFESTCRNPRVSTRR